MHRPNRPDRPLVVKCSFDGSNKRITFSSARNCSYDLLRSKVEQCFSLFTTLYAITYKDDDGEIAEITTDSELTEAIQYFQAGSDDPPLSSAASILSGRSFGNRKITLRVQIVVDYDGPSLSDTSSLASIEEYTSRNGSQVSLSFSSHHQEFDDDSVTLSSRNAAGVTGRIQDNFSNREVPFRSGQPTEGDLLTPTSTQHISSSKPACVADSQVERQVDDDNLRGMLRPAEDLFSDRHQPPAHSYPENPLAVFERLKLEEASAEYGHSSVDYGALSEDNRAAAWLRDQNNHTIGSMLVAFPTPSLFDGDTKAENDAHPDQLGGDLALRRNPHGKYYYSYTSVGSSSQAHDSGYDDGFDVGDEADIRMSEFAKRPKPRPTSMHLNWLASQQIFTPADVDPNPPYIAASNCSLSSSESDLHTISGYAHIDSGIPPDVLPYLPVAPPPLDQLTDCAECGVVLDAIRYVCTTCGESTPLHHRKLLKGKGRNDSDDMSYQLLPHSSSSCAASSRTLVNHLGLTSSLGTEKPLPSLPPVSRSECIDQSGYELCAGCIESAGITHAIEVGLAPTSSLGRSNSLSSSQDSQSALSQWIRSAPKQKGQLRHGYLEKAWGHKGWEDVEQDDCDTCKCSTCNTVIPNIRYKCASCPKFNLCRACYSQVHLIHPSHAFLVVPDKPRRSHSEPAPSLTAHLNAEQSMVHAGVKCAYCLLDIVGARFHCAICESIEICSNCESAGLPGNLDSWDEGHNSSHIMIKIPYPVEIPEVQAASRRAVLLWTGRDAANVQRSGSRSKSNSVISSYARTIVGFRTGREHRPTPSQLDHHNLCNSCGQPIVGVRYQCASCSSDPTPYSLCASCELRSYALHDPMHIFFKLPRPVHQPLRSPCPMIPNLYRNPAGHLAGGSEPKEYLKNLVHNFAICDRCMTRIQGEWYRCAYCGMDLCDACEELDTHDDTHVFLVFKSTVDMQLFRYQIPIFVVAETHSLFDRSFADLENPTPVIPYPVYC